MFADCEADVLTRRAESPSAYAHRLPPRRARNSLRWLPIPEEARITSLTDRALAFVPRVHLAARAPPSLALNLRAAQGSRRNSVVAITG